MTSFVRLGLLAVALATACDDWGPQYCEGDWAAVSEDEAPPMSVNRVVAQVNAMQSNAVDILFVIDDSSSMKDEQQQLGIWSHELFDVLSPTGELPDLHIGVVSSSLAIAGRSGCQSGSGQLHTGGAKLDKTLWLSDVAGPEGRVRNYAGTLEDTFAQMALVGDRGCGFEQPFAAARIALTSNPGFLRSDALLLVVFVTDEDDCSATDTRVFADNYADDACSELGPVTSYRCFEHGVKCYDGKGSRAFGDRSNCRADESSEFLEHVSTYAKGLKGLKAHDGQVIVAGIYGKPNGIHVVPDERQTTYQTPRLASVCPGTSASKEGIGATPAVRMNALMAEFGGRASQSSICDDQLAWAMRDVGLVTRDVATRSHCLRGAILDRGSCRAAIQGHAIGYCDGTSDKACFTIEEATDECAETHTQLAFRLENAADDQEVTVSCDVDLDAPPMSAEAIKLRQWGRLDSVSM